MPKTIDEKTQTTYESPRRLNKSNSNRIFDGICGGLAEYFNVDATLIRVLWIIFTFLSPPAGIVGYIIGIVVIPRNPKLVEDDSDGPVIKRDLNIILGIFLIFLGLVFITDRLDIFPFDIFYSIRHSFQLLWPILLISVGGWLIYTYHHKTDMRDSESNEISETTIPKKRFTRSIDNKMLAGVCSGLAKYFNVDPTLVRILWVVGTLFSKGLGILVYIVFWIFFQEE